MDFHLGYFESMGANAIRVWLSFPAWEHYDLNPVLRRNVFIDRFKDLQGLCENRMIYVMPVLWCDIPKPKEPGFQDRLGRNHRPIS